MGKRIQMAGGMAVIVAGVILLWMLLGKHGASSGHVSQTASVPGAIVRNEATQTTNRAPVERASRAVRLMRIDPGQVLATVNGHDLKLADLVPVKGSDPVELSPEVYQYLLDRAVNRELVFETADTSGIRLTEAQTRQLGQFKSMRNQPEPGGVSKLNSDAATVAFELRDAQAFMLQTSLMAAQGQSPDVTENEALNYFQNHTNEYAVLPDDVTAWQQIDAQIRNKLAQDKRMSYQGQLTAYMEGLRAGAKIQAISPPSVEVSE